MANLPRDCRTIIPKPPVINVMNIGPKHSYGTFDLKLILGRFVTCYNNKFGRLPNRCKIGINIDGVSPFRSSQFSFWTMLIKISKLKVSGVFPVSVAYGRGKPPTLQWLLDGLKQIKQLCSEGLYNTTFTLTNICADLPAKNYFLGTTSFHSLNSPCEKCTATGTTVDKHTVIKCSARPFPARTDADFRGRVATNLHTDQEPSPVTTFDTLDMVKDIVIDPMHCVYLGVCKNILKALSNGRGSMRKLSNESLAIINARMRKFSESVPRGTFDRALRPFCDHEKYKGSEYRIFLLYAVIYVFHPLDPDLYCHLLHLSIAIRILDDPTLVTVYGEYAHNLLKTFLTQCSQLYQDGILTINFHNLSHLYADVKRHGTLSEISAFAYESFNICYGKYLRSRKYPVVEFHNRYMDMVNTNLFMFEKRNAKQNYYLVHDNLESLYCKLTNTIYTKCEAYFMVDGMDSRIVHIKQFPKLYSRWVSPEEEKILFQNNNRECISVDDGDKFVAIPLCHSTAGE